MNRWSTEAWQKIGIIFAVIFGVWGAGLSTYQEYRSYMKGAPMIYTQLSLTRPNFKEGDKHRAATFVVTIQNSGQTSLTFLPAVSVVVFNPESSFSQTLSGQLATTEAYGLPKTLKPGEQTAATFAAEDSDSVFGPNLRYSIILQSVEGPLYFAENMAGPIKDSETYKALMENVKYQSKAEFQSRPTVMVQSR